MRKRNSNAVLKMKKNPLPPPRRLNGFVRDLTNWLSTFFLAGIRWQPLTVHCGYGGLVISAGCVTQGDGDVLSHYVDKAPKEAM